MRVFVAGGAGFIGSNVVKELLSRNIEVIALDDLSTGINNLKNIQNSKLQFVKGDIRDEKLVNELMSRCTHVIHQACKVIAASLENPYEDLDVNGRGTLILLEAARKNKIQSFIYSSSASVYGDTKGKVMGENLLPDPSNPYAISKMTGEYYTKFYHKIHGLNTVALRYFNVYGPHQNAHSVYGGVIPIFCKLAKEGKPLRIYGDGNQTRDFTYIDDVARITVDCLFNDIAYGKYFNVGFGEETTIQELAMIFKDIKDTGIIYEPSRTIDNVINRQSDCSYIYEVLDYSCKTSLKDGIKVTYDWYSQE